MLLLDLSHTSHTSARTGVQRVTRSLQRAIASSTIPICYDPYARTWRELERWEKTNIVTPRGPLNGRGARWPWWAKIRGRLRHQFGHPRLSLSQQAGPIEGLIVPEIFSTQVAVALPRLFSAVAGPRVAVFHDAIPLKFPELSPAKTVARFPAYLRELLAFDGIAAVSADSGQALLDYWHWLGVKDAPPVRPIPLGIDCDGGQSSESPRTISPPTVLSVGSIEGRKNHLVLLEACERLWSSGIQFHLRLIGLAHPQTGRKGLERVRQLQAAGRPLRYNGPVDDTMLESAYEE